MASTYDDTVFDFDLNYLRQTSNNTVISNKLEKQRKAILVVKKKTIATDLLIRKYYAKRDVLDQTEQSLLASKEECKNICIDYRKALETSLKFENDAEILRNTNKQLEEKCFNSESQYGAIKSHTNQLQLLINEHETQIQALKIESKLEKANTKNYEKKVVSLQAEKEKLIKHICLFRDVIFGKKKINKDLKLILQRYKASDQAVESDDSVSREGNNDEDDIFEDIPMSPFYTDNSPENNGQAQAIRENVRLMGKQVNKISENILKRDYNDRDYDCNNEVVSVDTGRGSSLAFSDGDKSFHSPDYYINDSLLSAPIGTNKGKRQLVDIATSPLIFEDHSLDKPAQIATRPIIFDDLTLTNEEGFQKRIDICVSTNASGVVTKSKCSSSIMIDKAVSPITTNILSEVSTSPVRNICKEIATSPIKIFDNTIQPNDSSKTLEEKECLELNNSNNICHDNDSDCEIEMILSRMRLDHQLITPIPTTPAKLRSKETVQISCVSNNHTDNQRGFLCQDAALVREENKKLQASISDLAKEIMNIKILLKNHSLLPTNGEQYNGILSNCESINDSNNDVTIGDNEQNSLNISNSVVTNDQESSVNKIKEKQNNLSFECLETVKQKMPTESAPSLIRNEELLSITNENGPITEKKCVNRESQKPLDRLRFKDSSFLTTQFKPAVETNTLSVSEDVTCNNPLVDQALAKDNHGKVIKTKKLTQLEKFKMKILPKSKIKRDKTPVKRLRFKPKQLSTLKKKITGTDSSASLNDKSIYEKACKVMADLKSQQGLNIPKVIVEDCVKTIKNRRKRPEKTSDQSHSESEKKITPVLLTRKTRSSSSKCVEINDPKTVESTIDPVALNVTKESPQKTRKRAKRTSIDMPEIQCKRVLRSSTIQRNSVGDNAMSKKPTSENNIKPVIHSDNLIDGKKNRKESRVTNKKSIDRNASKLTCNDKVISYSDLDLFSDDKYTNAVQDRTPKEKMMFCRMVEKYGVQAVKFSAKKVSDSVTNTICKKIDEDIAKIIELPPSEVKNAMNNLVLDIRHWNVKQFLSGFIKYLKDPSRKIELFSKATTPPVPPMTKSEQVLLYILTELKVCWPGVDIIKEILRNIEYTIFSLNRTPDFDVVESMSHFYAVLCRYGNAKSRLRIFILDAMYCIQFKSVPLIKQCMDVWGHILPLAHMGIAKSPLVTCMVYLLHFYKCEDRYHRVQDIRNILKRKYFYQITDWNETKILEMFKNSINDLKDIPAEKKMMRIALILLAKRHGPRWCQKNIIQNLLLPMIEEENTPNRIKEFCVSVLGPLLKPYPNDMKVHCEIIMNQLIDMLHQKQSPKMKEAIVTSLIFMNRHNHNRVNQALLFWNPEHVSSELEDILRDYVKSKPVKIWKSNLSRLAQ